LASRKQRETYRRLLAKVEPPHKSDLPADKWTLHGEARRKAIAAFLEWYAQRPALRSLGDATRGYPIEAFALERRRELARRRTENTGYYRNTKPASCGSVKIRRPK
jgi:hypothetical protein